MTPTTATAPVTVYIMRDASGAALYVGCTSRGIVRTTEHRNQPWYRDVASVDIEHYEDRPTGFARERQLIADLRPEHTGVSGKRVRQVPPPRKPSGGRPRRETGSLLDAYLAGATMQEVGDAHGVSRERVRQLLDRDAPAWLLALEKRRRQARVRLRREAARHRRMIESVRLCRVCGDIFAGRHGLAVTCGDECRDLFMGLRQHLPDHTRIGHLKGQARYLTAESSARDAALVCYERGLPIFTELPDDIQRQVRGETRSWETPTVSRPCEECGTPTANPRFCSHTCYRTSGRVGQPAEEVTA